MDSKKVVTGVVSRVAALGSTLYFLLTLDADSLKKVVNTVLDSKT